MQYLFSMFQQLILNSKKNTNRYPVNVENASITNLLNDDQIITDKEHV